MSQRLETPPPTPKRDIEARTLDPAFYLSTFEYLKPTSRLAAAPRLASRPATGLSPIRPQLLQSELWHFYHTLSMEGDGVIVSSQLLVLIQSRGSNLAATSDQ